jgi:ABC-type glycerol-3-phosphate transport system substrate-binding protein
MRVRLGLALLLAGLGLGLVVTLARGPGSSDTVELVVWDWWSPSTTESYKAYFDDLTRQFQARHPEIQLRFQFIPFNNYPQKLTTGFAGDRPPDVFQCSVAWAGTLYDRGAVRELNDLVDRTPDLAMDRFLPSAARHNQKDGRIYGIPIVLDANCLIYNTDLFEQLGLSTDPHAIDSWEAFLEVSQRLTLRDETGRIVRAGFGMNGYNLSAIMFHPWLYANGGTFYDESTGRAVFDSEEGIEAARFLLRLRDEKVVPRFSPQLDIQEQFIAGKIAMYIDGTWSGKYLERNSEGRVRFAMTNLPPGPHGRGRTTVSWANMLMMSKACRHPEAAWAFIRFVAGVDGALLRLKHLGQNSPRRDFYDRPEWKQMVAQKPYLGMVEEICEGAAKRPSLESKAAESAFGPYFEGLLISGTAEDVPRVLRAAAGHLTRIYERARAFFVTEVASSQLPVVSCDIHGYRTAGWHGPAPSQGHAAPRHRNGTPANTAGAAPEERPAAGSRT